MNNPNTNTPLPWQDLDPLILSQIFKHLPLHDQLFGPPFVCHSWFNVSLHTLFNYPHLDLSPLQYLDHDDKQELPRYTLLLKLAIKHCNAWISVYFSPKNMPNFYTLMYIAENTPNISTVILPKHASVDVYPIFMSIMYWGKNLRAFHAPIPQAQGFKFLTQLVDYCKNIVELGVHGEFMEREVDCIVDGFPCLKVLDFSDSVLSANALNLVLLDHGRLRCIRELNVLHCLFLDEDGKDMRGDYVRFKSFRKQLVEKASSIKSLRKFVHCLGKICHQCRTLEDK